MSGFVPVTPLADPRRPMPRGHAACRAIAEAAVNSLTVEMRKLALERDEWPLARAAYQVRYWQFVRSLCAIAGERAAARRAA